LALSNFANLPFKRQTERETDRERERERERERKRDRERERDRYKLRHRISKWFTLSTQRKLKKQGIKNPTPVT